MLKGFFVLAQTTVDGVESIQSTVPAESVEITELTVVPGEDNIVEDKPQPSFLESAGGLIPMILIVVVMFYLMYRSQKKEQQRRVQMIDSVKAGDQVLTVGGIIGKVISVKDDIFEVEIAKNVRVDMSKSAIGSVIEDKNAAETGEVTKK